MQASRSSLQHHVQKGVSDMQRLKILVLAAMAVFALAAIVSATASAALPLFLTAAGTQPLLLISGLSTIVSQLQELGQAASEQIECPEVHYTFHQEANTDLGTFHFDFLKCHAAVGGIEAKCTGLGEATAGEILVLGTYHAVFDSLTTLGAADLMLVNEVHFACSIILVKVKGELLCLISVPGGKGSKVKLDCKKTAGGDPEESTYWNNAGTEVKIPNGLLASRSDGTFKDSSEGASGEGTVTNDAGTAEPVELMF
jgi:hypothetical protein